MTYDAIVFDSDGVLVEPTAPDVHRDAVRDALAEFGVAEITAETVERLVELSGDDRDQLSAASVERVCREHDVDPEAFWRRREELAAQAQLREIRRGRKALYPDVEVIHAIERPLAVVSNNQHDTLDHVLREHDIADRFEAAYGRAPTLEGIRRRKPAVHYVERAVDELAADRPLLVGDSVVDLEAADGLGIDSVFVRRPHRESYDLPDPPTYEVDSLAALPDLLSR